MFTYLEWVSGNWNRQQNAENKYQNLYQSSKDFKTFWKEFQWLAVKLDQTQVILISDLISKLLLHMQCYIVDKKENLSTYWNTPCSINKSTRNL